MSEEMQTMEATPSGEVVEQEVDMMDGWDDESTEEVEEVVEVQEEESEEVEEETTEEDTTEAEEVFNYNDLDLKVLSENKKLSEIAPEEAQEVFQKGLDYDRKNGQLAPFKEIADLYGIDLAKMQETLFNDYFKYKAEKDGLTEAIVKKEYEVTKAESRIKQEQEAKKSEEREATSKKNAEEKMFKDFIKEFPDVKAEDIPKEVIAESKKGVSLVEAYKDHEYKQMKNEIAKLKKQLTNKKTSPVKSTTKYGTNPTGSDPMFDGWDD